MAKGGSSTTQTQTVTQQTDVTVQNVIQGKELEPLERVKLLADVFATIDNAEAQKKSAGVPNTSVILQPVNSALSVLQNPTALLMITAAAGALILLIKRR